MYIMEDNIVKYNAVMYTDGSCLPPRGAYGGGCHGYLYTDEDFKKNGDKPPKYTVTDYGYLEKHELTVPHEPVDGGELKQPTELKPSLYYNAAYAYGSEGTNNKSELLAVISTISILAKEHPISGILFCTDSMYVINVYKAVTADLDKRAWLNEERPNLELWAKLADTLVAHSDIKISIKKVTAHGTAIGNNVADRLAFAAREMAKRGSVEEVFTFYTGKYWNDKLTPHPMLNFKQVYFNLGIMPDVTEHLYAIMDYPAQVELGKKSAEPIFGITIFKEPVEILNNVINTYASLCKGPSVLTTLDLRVLHTQQHLKMFELLGSNAYSVNRRRLSLLGEADLVTPIKPPGLAQGALIKTLDMYKLYKKCCNTTVDDGVMRTIDITNQMFDINDKGKFVFKFEQGDVGPMVNIAIAGVKTDLVLGYGKEGLTRNQYKKLEADKPKVTLITVNRNKNLYEYFLLIETEKVSGIYCNYYVNKIHL